MTKLNPTYPAGQGPRGSTFWRAQAAETELPCFPIKIFWDPVARKWTKTPLCRRGHLDATTDVGVFGDLWLHSNGYGIRMGGGLYGLDCDFSKPGCRAEEWFDAQGVTRETRTHETISGGLHRIFRVPEGQGELPTRQGIVVGLDGRGSTGWLAFGAALGAAYRLLDDSEPAWLPEGACEDIRVNWSGNSGPVELGELTPVDGDAVTLKLALAMGRNKTLRRRWHGERPPRAERQIDRSLSAWDHSMAKLLAIGGMSESEVFWLIAHEFEHGIAKRDPWNARTERALRRSAAVVTKQIRDEQAALAAAFNQKTTYTPEDIEATFEALFGGPK